MAIQYLKGPSLDHTAPLAAQAPLSIFDTQGNCGEKTEPQQTSARLLFKCDNRHEVIPEITNFLYRHGAAILDLDQHWSAPQGGLLFMRIEYGIDNLRVTPHTLELLFAKEIGARFNMDWRISYGSERKKLAILVSKYDHALLELLSQWQRGILPTDITMVISNHPDLREKVERYGIAFHHVPVTKQTKVQAEEKILGLLEGQASLLVLARYMQILSPEFVGYYPNRIINIHHSFLPAFMGASPYKQAHMRGVKLIGATAHFVTADLDTGPIIEQDVMRVSHRRSVKQLQELGCNIERSTLARAVRWAAEDRIIVHDHKTVVFYR